MHAKGTGTKQQPNTPDVAGLVAAFSAGALIQPTAGHANLVDLALTIAAVTGARRARGHDLTGLREVIGSADHLVVVMADGMGMNVLESLSSSSFLRRHVRMPLHTVFPSASAVALTTLATGEWPARHLVTGWWTHLPELGFAGALLPFVMRDNPRSLTEAGADIDQLIHAKPLVDASRRDVLTLYPKQFVDSPYSTFCSGTQPRRPFDTLQEAAGIVASHIQAATAPTYTYLYTHRVDALAHRYGSDSPEVRDALLDLDNALTALHGAIAGKARIVVTADHGLLDAAEGEKHLIPPGDRLLSDLRVPPSGDSRVLYLHAKPGRADSIRARLLELVDGRFYVVTYDEARTLRLFGPGAYARDARSRMGDLIAISMGADVVEYPGADGLGNMLAQIAHHSGLHRDEMLIPLIVA